MPRLKRPQKEELVAEMAEKFKRAQVIVVAEYKGLTVAEMTELRRKCTEKDVEVKVYKNRLVKRGLVDADCESPDDILTGANLVGMGYDDPVTAAKVLAAFAKDHEHLQIKGGVFESKAVDAKVIDNLSKMASLEDLMASIIGSLQSPINQLVRNIDYPTSNLVLTLKAVSEKQGDAA
jgi:large subunit ribosomal protein L10